MDSSLRAELDALRLRVYGRAVDGALDTDTVQRLQELEAQAREDRSARDDEPVAAPDLLAPSGSSPAPPERPAIDAPSLVEAPANGPVRRSWRRPGRIMLMLWAASVATSTAIAAAATFAVVGIMPVAVVNDAPQTATLEPDAAVDVPVGSNGAGASSATYEFYGLTLFETSWNVFGGGGGDCFAAVLTADIPEGENVQGGYSMSGPSYGGCRVGNFPATLTIAVDSAAPPELRARYPDGALQFIKDGDRIGVFLGATADCPAPCTQATFDIPSL